MSKSPLSHLLLHAKDRMTLETKKFLDRGVSTADLVEGTQDYVDARYVASMMMQHGAPSDLITDPHVALDFLKKRNIIKDDIMKMRPKARAALIKDLKKEYRRAERERNELIGKKDELLNQLFAGSHGAPSPYGDGMLSEYEAEIAAKDIEQASILLRGDLRLEKPQGSSLHHLIEFMRKSRNYTDDVQNFVQRLTDFNFQSFIVEHDWAKAFSGATDFYAGDYPLPFDNVCFEFRINGMRELVLIGHDPVNACHVGMLVTGINERWYVNADRFILRGGKVESVQLGVIERNKGIVEQFLNLLADQIRAICIMLDARAAEYRRVAASERLNAARIRSGKTPARDYNVVTLSRQYVQRHHARPGEDSGSPRRLHLRRGHWRHFDHDGGQIHYANEGGFWVSKTWINWMLVGDPDLGFVEKHYRL